MTRTAAGIAACLGVLATHLLACGPPLAQTRLEKDVQKIRQEEQPDKLFERGKAFASVGDLTRAEQYLSAAIDAKGDEKTILPWLMRVCVEARRYRVGIEYGDRYLKRHPDDHSLRYLIGTLYAATEETDLAREQFEMVLRARPNDAEVHYALGVLLRDQIQDMTQADHHFRQYLRLSPNGPHAGEARASTLKSVP